MVPGQMIYFLRPVGKIGPIKIGYSCNPLKRLNAFRTWSPIPLELAACGEAHRNLEVWLHRYFISDWRHGEWFEWSAKLQSVIDSVAAKQALPSWVQYPQSHKEWRRFLAEFPKGKTKLTAPAIFPIEAERNAA